MSKLQVFLARAALAVACSFLPLVSGALDATKIYRVQCWLPASWSYDVYSFVLDVPSTNCFQVQAALSRVVTDWVGGLSGGAFYGSACGWNGEIPGESSVTLTETSTAWSYYFSCRVLRAEDVSFSTEAGSQFFIAGFVTVLWFWFLAFMCGQIIGMIKHAR